MKKIIVFSLMLIVGAGQIYAQLPKWALDLGKRSEQADSTIVPLVTYLDAVQPALSIIRQQYRLERNGDFFGRQNKPYFAETYSLGIKISGGTILHRSVVFPWENDADYQRINGSGKYKPAYFWSMQRSVMESEWKTVELELGTQYVTPFTSDSSLYRHTDATADFGLPIDETVGSKQGYMIWAYSISNLQDSAMQVKFQQSELKIEAKTDGKAISVKPDNISNVLGGIFIVPQVERAGYIKLLLVGVAARNSHGEWSLYLMTTKSGELTKIDESGKGDKTRKKKKRDDSEKITVENTDDSELTPIK